MNALSAAARLFRGRDAGHLDGPIGIDFALEAMHLMQLSSGPDQSRRLRARATIAYDDSREAVLNDATVFHDHLRRALSMDGFRGRKAVVAVPSGMFRTVSINYTASNGNDDSAILKKMRDRVDGDLQDFVIDYMPVKSCAKINEKLALVAISDKQRILQFLKFFEGAKVSVDALEIGPLAICRLVGAMSSVSNNENVLVVNSGRQASYLTLLSGSDLLFDQQIGFGELEIIGQVSDALDMSEEMTRDLIWRQGLRSATTPAIVGDSGVFETLSEIVRPQFSRLAEEIKRVCLYAAAETRGGAVSNVFLLGGIARWPGADTLLGRLVDVSVSKIPDPLAPLTIAENSESGAAPEMAVATGLALREVSSGG